MVINEEKQIVSLKSINGRLWVVGAEGVTDIEPYHENGLMDYVVWFKVFVDGKVKWRVNMAAVECVEYGLA